MNISYLIDRLADEAPRRAGWLLEGGARDWREIADRIARLAGVFRQRGIGAGDRVAILAANGAPYLEAALAAARIGAILQPMNTRLAAAELAHQIVDAAPSLILVGGAQRALAAAARAAAGGAAPALLALDGPEGVEAALASASPVADLVPRATDDVAALFYTSGTTGRPKGVMLTHGGLLSNAHLLVPELALSADDVALHAAPMFHVADFSASFAHFVAGARHCFVPGFAPEPVAAAIARHRATTLVLVPTMIALLLADPAARRHDLSSLRFIFYGGSPMPEALLRETASRLGCGLVQGYGQTELTHTACLLSEADHRRALAEPALLKSCGRPMAGVELAIVDAAGKALPAGAVGEIAVRCPHLMKGYWRDPAATAAALAGGWLRTGDLARRDGEGYVFLVDRKKDMIITGGENVYSAEVEAALLAHPDVAEAAVIGAPDPVWGERVHAVIVLRPGAVADPAALQAHCRGLIAGYKVPRSLAVAASLPKTAAGKVQKHALRAALAAPAEEGRDGG
jgi:acyl-CoA synthetase (AMP-forming)/AMP-acid ligase II